MQAAFKAAPNSSNTKADIDWATVKVEDKSLMHQVTPFASRLADQLSACCIACSIHNCMLRSKHSFRSSCGASVIEWWAFGLKQICGNMMW